MKACNSQHADEMFNAVYEKYQSCTSYYAYRILGNREEARDISANSFVSLWKIRNSFHSAEKMKSFIRICTKRACLNRLKSIERRESSQAEVLLYYYSRGTVEIMDAFAESRDDAVMRIIRSLDMKYQECIWLYYFKKMTFAQIANKLNLSERNVKYFLSKGRWLIRSAFSSN
jgi:RNA polymerase sigma factor (sigma-70 family)